MGKMSQDRVRFRLLPRYYTQTPTPNGMHLPVCVRVLYDAFGDPPDGRSWEGILRDSPFGFPIVCRPSQFARFVIIRYERGNCINGIRDMEPEMFTPDPPVLLSEKVYREVAADMAQNRSYPISRPTINLILEKAGVEDGPVKPETDEKEIDVSQNPAERWGENT
jgi:hypothetical protein